MIKIENVKVCGWEPAIRGMRSSWNSWGKSDSYFSVVPCIAANDLELMMRLAKSGSSHAKYRRMIIVYCDVTAPLYWWKEMDTYKVGTVCNSCSTMHTISKKEFTLYDFSHEHLLDSTKETLKIICEILNKSRVMFLETKDKQYWWQMIQLLPTSYNQKRTLMLNYEILSNIYHSRKNHKLDEWIEFCKWIEELPYSKLITLEDTKND